MITNREISSEQLLTQAVEEIVESARDNDISEQTIAETLRDQASEINEPNSGE